jgi:triosephosphate isomerase
VARLPLLAGNWKMNPASLDQALTLAGAVEAAAAGWREGVEVAVFPPFPWLLPVHEQRRPESLRLGAQNCHWADAGAFTGEVAPSMLRGWCDWVILGHSERRTLFGETDEAVARKARSVIDAGLGALICVGEREDEHVAGRTDEIVGGQLARDLAKLTPADAARLVIAYEPVWAIGTGRSADAAHAGPVMDRCRAGVAAALGEAAAAGVRILYGGSVKAANVAEYVSLESCDGCLVGGASLLAEEFATMIEVVAARGLEAKR